LFIITRASYRFYLKVSINHLTVSLYLTPLFLKNFLGILSVNLLATALFIHLEYIRFTVIEEKTIFSSCNLSVLKIRKGIKRVTFAT